MCSTTVIGSRPEQQDRYVMAPSLLGGELSLFAVFDGTTGDYAAEWLRENCIPMLLSLDSYRVLGSLLPDNRQNPMLTQPILAHLIQDLYMRLDRQLLHWCHHQSATHPPDEAFKYDYTASTGVICLIHHPSAQLCVSHVADSHAVIAAPQPGARPGKDGAEGGVRPLISFSLTKSHKPDEREELVRINQAGGQLVYLHDQKPFIRGKDFRTKRKAIQLNYSRAFGSKDLKHSGLISVPDITMIPLRHAPKNSLAIKLQNGRNGGMGGAGTGTVAAVGSEDAKKILAGPSNSSKIGSTDSHPEKADGLSGAEDSPATHPGRGDSGSMGDTLSLGSNSSSDGERTSLTPTSQNDPVHDLEPVLVTIDNSYSIHSPSVPIINTGLSMGSNIGQPSAGLFNINDEEGANSVSDSESPQQTTKAMSVDELAKRQGVVDQSTMGNNTTTTAATTSSSTTTTTTAANGEINAADREKAELLEKYARIFAEDEHIRHNYPFPLYQTLNSFHEVNRLQHSPALRMVQGIVDIRALVIGSDGVFDVLTPTQSANTAFAQLARCLNLGCHQAPVMQHIPPGQLQQFISTHHDFLLKMRTKGAISIYPDFIAHALGTQDPQWNYSPSDAVVSQALLQHELRRSGDNVTCLVIFF